MLKITEENVTVHSFQKNWKNSIVEVLHGTHNLHSPSGIPEYQFQHWHFELKTLLEEIVKVRGDKCFMFPEFQCFWF